MTDTSPQPVDVPDKHRPDPEHRWGADNDRTDPVRVDVRTRWLYNDNEGQRTGDGCICCPGRHAFSRGGRVVWSDVPSASDHDDDLSAHIWRAITAFGDDADLVIEVRRAEP